ncbi:MAG: response regulator transcription factor, partial [Acidimicrobiia bacterium]|nr:response regulator transcription factor [Acidimicrobiia bacterium]
LDLMLPSLSGLDVLRTLRTISSVPVIIVTAKDGEGDKVAGLELGADDYVTKPFSMRELVARVGANVRRSAVQVDASDVVLVGGDVKLDVGRHVTTVRGREVELRPKEFALLELLLLRGGKVVTRDDLIAEVWGYDYFGDTKTLDVHIKRLRSKIEVDPKHPQHIVTVRGMGYKFSL